MFETLKKRILGILIKLKAIFALLNVIVILSTVQIYASLILDYDYSWEIEKEDFEKEDYIAVYEKFLNDVYESNILVYDINDYDEDGSPELFFVDNNGPAICYASFNKTWDSKKGEGFEVGLVITELRVNKTSEFIIFKMENKLIKKECFSYTKTQDGNISGMLASIDIYGGRGYYIDANEREVKTSNFKEDFLCTHEQWKNKLTSIAEEFAKQINSNNIDVSKAIIDYNINIRELASLLEKSTDIKVLYVKAFEENIENTKEDINNLDINESNETTTKSKEIEYIYNNAEKEVNINTDKLNSIQNAEEAEKAVDELIGELTDEEKNSANVADKIILFGEEAISKTATLKIDSDKIVINDNGILELLDKAKETKGKITNSLSSIKKIRGISTNARIVTSSSGRVSISKEKLNNNIDNVKVETPYAGVSFSAKSVSNVSLENKGTNKIAVDFETNKTSEKIKISFPNMGSDKKYMAVVDENGKVIGGKYNPITRELTAKIDASGVYSVFDNEKNFSDIKNKSAEMQEAIKLLASKGIISGISETEFSPDKSISRAEVAAIILRTLSKLDENADGGFSDVTKANWYYGTAGSAKNAGIINGYEDNTFRGNVVIPKIQIVSVSARVLKNEMGYYDVSDVEKALSEYGDSTSIAQWAKSDVALATDANMVLRRTDSLFGGNDEMTRGDAAIILKRLFDKVW